MNIIQSIDSVITVQSQLPKSNQIQLQKIKVNIDPFAIVQSQFE